MEEKEKILKVKEKSIYTFFLKYNVESTNGYNKNEVNSNVVSDKGRMMLPKSMVIPKQNDFEAVVFYFEDVTFKSQIHFQIEWMYEVCKYDSLQDELRFVNAQAHQLTEI